MAAADGGSKKAAAASDGSVAAAGRRRELRSSSGSAGVLSGRGSGRGPQPAPEARPGFLFGCAPRQAARANYSVPAAAHLPAAERGEGCRVHPIVQTLARSSESAGPPSPRSRSPPPLAPPSLPGEAAEAAGSAEGAGRRRAAGTAAAEAGAAPGAGRRGVRRGTPPWPRGREAKPGKSSCTWRRTRLRAAVPGRPRGLRLPRSPLLFLPPLPSGVCCGAAPSPPGESGEGLARARPTALRLPPGLSLEERAPRPNCHLAVPPGHPGRIQDADTSTLAFPRPAGLPLSPARSSRPQLGLWICSARVVTSGYSCRLRPPRCPFVFSV